MAKKRKKYYVVWEGVEPGIYDSWNECLRQVKSFPGAKYRAFSSREEAEAALYDDYRKHQKNKVSADYRSLPDEQKAQIKWDAWAVDAACSGNPGDLEYRGVLVQDRSEIFRIGPLADGTNNIGEFLALVHALALLKKMDRSDIAIYTDSRTAMSWLRHKRVKTKLKRTRKNRDVFELIGRAEQWLTNNRDISNEVIKWNTEKWGEIPADFGRK